MYQLSNQPSPTYKNQITNKKSNYNTLDMSDFSNYLTMFKNNDQDKSFTTINSNNNNNTNSKYYNYNSVLKDNNKSIDFKNTNNMSRKKIGLLNSPLQRKTVNHYSIPHLSEVYSQVHQKNPSIQTHLDILNKSRKNEVLRENDWKESFGEIGYIKNNDDFPISRGVGPNFQPKRKYIDSKMSNKDLKQKQKIELLQKIEKLNQNSFEKQEPSYMTPTQNQLNRLLQGQDIWEDSNKNQSQDNFNKKSLNESQQNNNENSMYKKSKFAKNKNGKIIGQNSVVLQDMLENSNIMLQIKEVNEKDGDDMSYSSQSSDQAVQENLIHLKSLESNKKKKKPRPQQLVQFMDSYQRGSRQSSLPKFKAKYQINPNSLLGQQKSMSIVSQDNSVSSPQKQIQLEKSMLQIRKQNNNKNKQGNYEVPTKFLDSLNMLNKQLIEKEEIGDANQKKLIQFKKRNNAFKQDLATNMQNIQGKFNNIKDDNTKSLKKKQQIQQEINKNIGKSTEIAHLLNDKEYMDEFNHIIEKICSNYFQIYSLNQSKKSLYYMLRKLLKSKTYLSPPLLDTVKKRLTQPPTAYELKQYLLQDDTLNFVMQKHLKYMENGREFNNEEEKKQYISDLKNKFDVPYAIQQVYNQDLYYFNCSLEEYLISKNQEEIQSTVFYILNAEEKIETQGKKLIIDMHSKGLEDTEYGDSLAYEKQKLYYQSTQNKKTLKDVYKLENKYGELKFLDSKQRQECQQIEQTLDLLKKDYNEKIKSQPFYNNKKTNQIQKNDQDKIQSQINQQKKKSIEIQQEQNLEN